MSHYDKRIMDRLRRNHNLEIYDRMRRNRISGNSTQKKNVNVNVNVGENVSKNKVFSFVLFAMYVVALLMNVINISRHDYGSDTENKRMKDIFNIISVFGFGFSLVFVTFSAVNKEWFYLTYFITLIFFVFGILVKKDNDGTFYPSRTIFTLSP